MFDCLRDWELRPHPPEAIGGMEEWPPVLNKFHVFAKIT